MMSFPGGEKAALDPLPPRSSNGEENEEAALDEGDRGSLGWQGKPESRAVGGGEGAAAAASLAKPPYSYIALIALAILQSPGQKLPLSGICAFIRGRFPYYRARSPAWQNAIRHNLSLHDCFVKEPRQPGSPGKGSDWRLHPASQGMFRQGSFLRRKKRFRRAPNPTLDAGALLLFPPPCALVRPVCGPLPPTPLLVPQEGKQAGSPLPASKGTDGEPQCSAFSIQSLLRGSPAKPAVAPSMRLLLLPPPPLETVWSRSPALLARPPRLFPAPGRAVSAADACLASAPLPVAGGISADF